LSVVSGNLTGVAATGSGYLDGRVGLGWVHWESLLRVCLRGASVARVRALLGVCDFHFHFHFHCQVLGSYLQAKYFNDKLVLVLGLDW